MKEAASTNVGCRACLVQRRSLRSIFQCVGSHTYADLIGIVTNVKIQHNDGFSDKICLTCRTKAEEAFQFKTLVEQSDKVLWRGNTLESGNKTKKIIFNNAHDIKVEIDCCKLENTLDNITEDVKDIKLDFKKGEDEIFYNNTMIKKLIKQNTEQMDVEDFINNIKHELHDPDINVEEDENDYFDDCEDKADDEDYIPPLLSKKLSEKLTRKKKRTHKDRKRSKDGDVEKTIQQHNREKAGITPVLLEDITEEMQSKKLKLKIKKEKIKPVYLEDISLIPSKPRQYPRKHKEKKNARDPQRLCPYCGKITKSIKQHLLTHTGERKYKCADCPKAFLSFSQLQDHIVIHSGIKNFRCDKCPAQFYKKLLLISHMTIHKEVRDHVCSICSKGFKRKSALRRHVNRHSSANKTIKCELCNMSFFEKSQLAHHMRIHTGERPYKCELCSQPYSYKHDFNRHCFKKHGVFMKRRSIRVMNEEVLEQERAAVRNALESQYSAETMALPPSNTQAAVGYQYLVDSLQLKLLFNNC